MKMLCSITVLCTVLMLTSCDILMPVDPIGPSVSTGDITDSQQNSFKISGTLNDPSYKNKRQEKKSGPVTEYGFVYGTTSDPAAGKMIKIGDAVQTFPFNFSTTIGGLSPNTTYRVWAYAKNTGGILTYGNESGKQTNDFPDPDATVNFDAPNGFRAPAEIKFSTPDNTPGAVYAWDFGDGTSSSAKNPTIIYFTGGTRLVKLRITANGKVKDGSKSITIDAAYSKVTITYLRVDGYLQSYSNGTGWDIATTGGIYKTGGPDMYIAARLDGSTYHDFYSTIKNDVTPAQGAAGQINWTAPLASGLSSRTFTATELNKVLYISLRDSDDGSNAFNSAYENIGSLSFKFSDLMTPAVKYPTTLSRQGSGSVENNALKMQMTLKWE